MTATDTTETPIAAEPPRTRRDHARWAVGWLGKVAEFGFVQGLVQVVTGLAGLLIIRSLAKEQYALYAIFFQMQATSNILSDIGIGIGVRSIGGRVFRDRFRFGELIKTALRLRYVFGLIAYSAMIPVAIWMLRTNGATWGTAFMLAALLVASAIPLLEISVLTVVQQLHGEYRRIQWRDLATALGRLAMVAGLVMTQINVALVALVSVITSWLQVLVTRTWTHEHCASDAGDNASDRSELWSLSARQFPNTLFFCFQGQITLLILTLVGNSDDIADIFALGRLSIFLTVISAAFANVLIPRFAACQDPKRLPRLYLYLIALTIAALAPILILAWTFPQPLLWILGNDYTNLRRECGLVVLATCLAHLSGTMWQLNSSRAWLFWTQRSWIVVTIITQIALAFSLNLSNLANVIYFQIITNIVPIPMLIADVIRGQNETTELGAQSKYGRRVTSQDANMR